MAQISNYLTIGNMESEGWTVKNLVSDAILSYENSTGPDNSRALKVSATNVSSGSYYVLIGTSQPLTLNEQEYYTISYWAKTTDAEGISITPWIQISDASINYPFVNLEDGILTGEWKQYKYTFSYPLQTSSKALVKFRIRNPGTIYLDNVQIGPANFDDIQELHVRDTKIYSVNIVEKNEKSKQVPVYKSNCPVYVPGYMNMQSKDNIPLSLFKGRSISWTNFSFADSVQVVIEILDIEKVPVYGKQVRVLPSRYNIIPEINGNKVSFMLTKPGQFSVEIGEDGYKNGLMIFANPLEINKPDINDQSYYMVEPDSSGVLLPSDIPATYTGIYFKKGPHNIDVFQVPAHIKNIYMADSAWIYGALQIHESKGVRVFGRGVLSQAKLNYRQSHGIDASVDSVTVEGIVVADFKFFAVRLMGSHNEINWVKVIGGWVYNCDGITAYANSKVSHCFIWANDDAIKVYQSNITWSDIVVWQLNNGGVIQISWGRTQAYNCHISRVDVLRAEWVKQGFNAALLSCVGNHYHEANRYSIQKDWIIEDVVTENPIPVIFGINPDDFSPNDIRNFTLKNWNVKMLDSDVFRNKIIAGNPQTIIDGFIFDNFIYNDILITKDNWLDVMKIDTSGFATPTFYPVLNNMVVPAHKSKIIPNPVCDVLCVEGIRDFAILKVYDLSSRLLMQGKGQRVDVTNLKKGIYFLTVDNNYEGLFIKD